MADPKYNMPVIRITDFNNKLILINGVDVCEYFESFSYKYVEGTDPDECEITFSFPSVSYLNIPQLSQRKGIIVQWGYVDSLSTRRQVGIKDIATNYYPQYIQLVVNCVAWADFLLQIGAEPTALTVMDEMLAAVKRGFELHYWLPDDLNKLRIYWDENKKFPEYVRIAGKVMYDFGPDITFGMYETQYNADGSPADGSSSDGDSNPDSPHNQKTDITDDEWIRAILTYEKEHGLADGTGHPHYGFNTPPYPTTMDEAVARFKVEYLPRVKIYLDVAERATMADFLFNTGLDGSLYVLDQYYKKDLGIKNGYPYRVASAQAMRNGTWSGSTLEYEFNSAWLKYAGQIYIKNLFLPYLNAGRDFYYKNIDIGNGIPDPAYYKTWRGRITNLRRLFSITESEEPSSPVKPDSTGPGPKAQAAGDANIFSDIRSIDGIPITDPFINALIDIDARSGSLNLSLLDQLDYLLKTFSDSFICDCRDNILEIRTRKLNGPAHRVYTWEGEPGYLLNARLSTKDRETDTTNSVMLGVDSETGEIGVSQTATTNISDATSLGYWFKLAASVDYGEIYQYVDGTFYVYPAGKHLACAPITDPDRIEQLKKALELALKTNADMARTLPEIIKLIIDNIQMPRGPQDPIPLIYSDLEDHPDPYLSELFWALREVILNPKAELDKVLDIKKGFINGSTSQWFERNSIGASPYSADEIAAAAARQTIESVLNRNWGEFTLLGDPLLTSSMRFMIHNLHKEVSGAYYIENCEHRISKSGYIVEASGFRVPPLYTTIFNEYKKIVSEKMEKLKSEAYIHNRGEWEKLDIGEYDPLNEYIIIDEAEDSLDVGDEPIPGGEGENFDDINF